MLQPPSARALLYALVLFCAAGENPGASASPECARVLLPTSATGTVDAGTMDTTVDLEGYYVFDDSVPPWASSILGLILFTADPRLVDSVQLALDTVPLWGLLRFRQDSGGQPSYDLRLTTITRVADRLAFATTARGGVSYDFAGRIRKLGNGRKDIALVGRFRMLRGGQVAGEGQVWFVHPDAD